MGPAEYSSEPEYVSARDVDPLENFDPVEYYFSRDWIKGEVMRVWADTNDGKPADRARISDLDQDHFLALLVTLESVLSTPLLAKMHEFDGDSADEFVEWVSAQVDDAICWDWAQENMPTGPAGRA